MENKSETVAVTIDPENGVIVKDNPLTPKKYGELNGDISGKGIKTLVLSVIQFAVEDFKALCNAGVIKGGKLAVDKLPRKICDGMTIADIKILINFFSDEQLGYWLSLGEMDISPRRIRCHLGFEG